MRKIDFKQKLINPNYRVDNNMIRRYIREIFVSKEMTEQEILYNAYNDSGVQTNEEVMVSIVKAEKEEGSHDIEFNLKEPIAGEWEKQVIRYSQLKTEIIEKLGEYVEFITISNTEHPEIEKIDELLKGFQKCDF